MVITVPASVADATAAAGEFRAGGTDLQERYRLGISSGPIVDIARLDLRGVGWRDDGGASVGALTTVAAIGTDEALRAAYPALTRAAMGLATPQVRAMATLGGNLAQRPQCWYYRSPEFSCWQSGADGCPARDGDHRHLAVFDTGPCIAPHPSTLGMALLVYGAEVETSERGRIPVVELFGDGRDPSRNNTLAAGELIVGVHLPPPTEGERAGYFRAISRFEAEWPAVEAVARVVVEDGPVSLARVAIGGVAPVPMALPHVDHALEGASPNDELIAAAAALAPEGAAPLPLTRWKLPLVAATVREVLRRALGS